MSKEIKESTVLVELDCLLDTRITTLMEYFGPQAVQQALENNYYGRWADHFPTVPYQDFRAAYDQRDRRVLKEALRTPILKVVQEFVLSTLQNTAATPFQYIPKIVLNIYPYQLTDEEVVMFKNLLVLHTKEMANVSVVSLSPEQIIPSYVNDQLSLMIMYDPQIWCEAQTNNGEFKKQACPAIGLFAPMIFKKYPLSSEELRMVKAMDMSPFEYTSKLVEPFVRVVYLPAESFSMVVAPQVTK